MDARNVLYERSTWLATAAELQRWADDVARSGVQEADGGFWGLAPNEKGLGGMRLFPWTPPPGCHRLPASMDTASWLGDAWWLTSGEAVQWAGGRWTVVAQLGRRPEPADLTRYRQEEAEREAAGIKTRTVFDRQPEDARLAILGEGQTHDSGEVQQRDDIVGGGDGGLGRRGKKAAGVRGGAGDGRGAGGPAAGRGGGKRKPAGGAGAGHAGPAKGRVSRASLREG